MSELTKPIMLDETGEEIRDALLAINETMKGKSGGSSFDYTAFGLPILELTGDVSAMTKENAVTLGYVYGDRAGTCTMKWQGSSSIYYPKKNYTIKFDNAFEAVEGWGEQKKYCLKANFIDHSHARNVVSGKLWGKTVKSRTMANEKLNELPNAGAIDGFPCIISLNGEFHGLYTFNIPKDGWMFGMGEGGNEQTEVMPFDTWIDVDSMKPITGEYTTTKGFTGFYVKKQSELSGGRSYVTWDTNKVVGGIRVRGHLYDENGRHVKNFSGVIDGVVNSYWEPAGDYDASVWKTATTEASYADPTAPFSVEIPAGHTVMWEIWMTQNFTSPDGSIVKAWSSEAEANNTWYLAWAKEGIQTYVVSGDRKEAIFCAEGTSEATRFQTEATFDGHNFKLEYATDEDNASWAFTSINRLIRACLDSDGTDLDTTIAKYLDWDSAIDYYIYACLLGGADMAGKNYLLATYDGIKWFFSAYDMDTTFGIWWDGKTFLPSNHYPTISWYAAYHKAMELIKNYKKDKFKARYAELRAGALSESAVAEAFSNFVAKIPSPVLVEDVKKWTTTPSSSASNLAQILNWYRMRVGVIDKEVETL